MSMTIIGGRVSIEVHGQQIRVETTFGLGIHFAPRYKDAYVFVPRSMRNQLSGLCGSYDGNPSNDLVDKNGVAQANNRQGHANFGKTWKVEDPEHTKYVLMELEEN